MLLLLLLAGGVMMMMMMMMMMKDARFTSFHFYLLKKLADYTQTNNRA